MKERADIEKEIAAKIHNKDFIELCRGVLYSIPCSYLELPFISIKISGCKQTSLVNNGNKVTCKEHVSISWEVPLGKTINSTVALISLRFDNSFVGTYYAHALTYTDAINFNRMDFAATKIESLVGCLDKCLPDVTKAVARLSRVGDDYFTNYNLE